MSPNDGHVLEILRDLGLISAADIQQAEDDASQQGIGAVDALIASGRVTQLDVTKAIANAASMEFVERIDPIPHDAIEAVPRHIARRYGVVPLGRTENALRVAVADPFDLETIDSLTYILKTDIEPVVAPTQEIDRAINQHYGPLGEGVQEEQTESEIQIKGGPEGAASDAPIIRLVNQLVVDAHRLRGSDIHIEPLEKRLRVRYRIDGVLQEMPDPPKRLQAAIISRIKIMSNMSIAEKRLPQDGRIQIQMADKAVDLRVSCIPTNHGESIVMRILDKSSLLLGLPELGFLSDDQLIMERILNLPDGIFLVTGPTGSGKTTTLYGCLNFLNKPDRKLITVEDPVEYILQGINQVQVNEEIDLTFAAALRSMLRQAPNIIMVGEIRDAETAQIAINASLTGHLVFSTLHTNDAPSAVTRLVDLGVKPFLVASAMRAVMAQRLVRKLCAKCSSGYEPSEGELSALGLRPSQITGANFQHAQGCDNCRRTGFRGRMGIFEIFLLNDEVQRLINEGTPTNQLRAKARQLGMRTLREDGIRKVVAGLTSVTEVVTATMQDEN
ncbi:MAG: Flp pilus assembly complex ATPase component TadA [Verrucomicrobiae bacterium]|nr:Flp pilus assembly complex ATPase component TadA [Verrucomicrobiae bacterium]